MDLLETLLYQDRNQLVQLINTYDFTCNQNSKKEIIQELYPRLLTIETVKPLYDQLSMEAKALILKCCFHENALFTAIDIEAIATVQEKGNVKSVLNELISIGWLYRQSNDSYVVPFQVKEQLKQVCLAPLKETELYFPDTESEGVLTFCDDLLVFIDVISERTLPLTKNGVLYKRDFQMLMKDFQVVEELPQEQWRFGYGRHFHHYPNRFSFIYDYCYFKKWIVEADEKLMVTDQVRQLDKMTPQALLKDIVRFWIILYKRPIPQIPFLFSFLKECLTQGKGVSVAVLQEVILPCVNEYYFDSKQDIIKKRLIEMLNHLEVISIEDVCGEYYITPGKAFPMVMD